MKLLKALTGVAGAIALTTGSAFADDLRWKMPVAFATNLPGLGSPAAWVADNLTTASDGSIQVRVYEPGKLVPPFDILQSVSDGKVSAGYTSVSYTHLTLPTNREV